MTTSSTWTAFHKTTSAELCPPDCTICLEPLTITTSNTASTAEHAVTINQCGHVFGHDCLTIWMREHNTCPVCRIEFFTQPEPIFHRHVDSERPLHFALGVYTMGNSSLEGTINSAMQSMTRLQVDAGAEAQDDQDDSEQPRRGGRLGRVQVMNP